MTMKKGPVQFVTGLYTLAVISKTVYREPRYGLRLEIGGRWLEVSLDCHSRMILSGIQGFEDQFFLDSRFRGNDIFLNQTNQKN